MEKWNRDGPKYGIKNSYYKGRSRLCLCTYDVQVGDTVYYDGYGLNCDIHICNSITACNAYWCYRIIGEVSPNADWIKEGMEWDELEFEVHEKDRWSDVTFVKFRNPKTKLFE